MKERFDDLYINPKTQEFYKGSDRRRNDDPEGLEVVGRIVTKTGIRAFFFPQEPSILWQNKDAQAIYANQQKEIEKKKHT